MSSSSSIRGSATHVIELSPVYHAPHQQDIQPSSSKNQMEKPLFSILGRFPRKFKGRKDARVPRISTQQAENRDETLPSPSVAFEELPRWNSPRINKYRVAATFWSFIVMGMNDAAYGLEKYYGLSYTVISLVFLTPFAGYSCAALLNNAIHMKFGQRGIAFIGPLSHLIAYIVIAVHPPYPALVVIFALAGFGNGVEDGAWNAWIGSMANANEILGFLHGLYGLGAVISPLAATTMVVKNGLPWYSFYYIMVSVAALEMLVSLLAFWRATASAYHAANSQTSTASTSSGNRMKEAILTRPAARVSWLCSAFLLIYVGVEVTLGGWIVTFMMQVRHGAAFGAGMVATGFWLGLTVGRIVLGFVTPRVGEKRAIAVYLPVAMALQLLFWLVPQFYVSAVAVSLQGFFLGPMFPAAVVAATKLLPRHLHVSAVGFASAFGGGGAAVFPFAVGAIAQAKGVQVLQPIVLAMLAALWVCWMALPRIGRKSE